MDVTEPVTQVELKTKFIRLRKLVALGDHIDGQRVCWVGGWDKAHVFYLVMVVTEKTEVISPTLPEGIPRTSRATNVVTAAPLPSSVPKGIRSELDH